MFCTTDVQNGRSYRLTRCHGRQRCQSKLHRNYTIGQSVLPVLETWPQRSPQDLDRWGRVLADTSQESRERHMLSYGSILPHYLLPHDYVDLSPANKILLVCTASLELNSLFRFSFSGSDPTGKRVPARGSLFLWKKEQRKTSKRKKKRKRRKKRFLWLMTRV